MLIIESAKYFEPVYLIERIVGYYNYKNNVFSVKLDEMDGSVQRICDNPAKRIKRHGNKLYALVYPIKSNRPTVYFGV